MGTTYLGNIKGPPGKQGDRGDRGLPGVNAVENVEAVTAYVKTPTPLKTALDSQYLFRQRLDRAGESLAAKLDTGAGDITLAVLGDSTGNDGDEWVALLRNKLLASRPKLRGEYTLWSDAAQAYPAMTVSQQGEGYVPGGLLRLTDDPFNRTAADLTGTTPDVGAKWVAGAGAFSVNENVATARSTGGTVLTDGGRQGDMTVTLEGVTLNTTPTAAARQLQVYAKYATASNHIWLYLNVSTTGVVTWGIFRRLAGTATQLVTGPNTVLPANATTKFDMQLKVIGQTVTATVNGASISAVLSAADADSYAGATQAGMANGNSGNTPATGATIDRFTLDVDAVGQGQALRIYNGSMPGSTLAYQAQRLAAMLPAAPDLVFLSSGHNYGAGGDISYLTAVTDLVAAIRARYPNAGIAVCSQNPEFQPWPNAGQHLRRLTALRVKALTEGWGYVPALEAFLSQPDGGASLVNPTDGIHPLPAGSQLWGDTAYQYVTAKTMLRPA